MKFFEKLIREWNIISKMKTLHSNGKTLFCMLRIIQILRVIFYSNFSISFEDLWKNYGFEDLPEFKRLLLVFINQKSGHNTGDMVWSQAKKLLSKFNICLYLINNSRKSRM